MVVKGGVARPTGGAVSLGNVTQEPVRNQWLVFWTTSCGRRTADGRWWTYWLTARSAGHPGFGVCSAN